SSYTILRRLINSRQHVSPYSLYFSFPDTATTEIYTLSLHDALPILAAAINAIASEPRTCGLNSFQMSAGLRCTRSERVSESVGRSEEHTSELQSRENLVCRLLLEKKKKQKQQYRNNDEV